MVQQLVRWKDKASVELHLDDRLPVTDLSNEQRDGYTTPDEILKLSHGRQSIYVPASEMTPATTSGAATGQIETSTNELNFAVLDFNSGTDEFAHFQRALPFSWDAGTIGAKVHWTTSQTSGDVVWALQAVSIPHSGPLDVAFGTAQTIISSAEPTSNDLVISTELPPLTPAGAPVAGEELIAFRIYRDANSGSDTMSGDARLIGVELYWLNDRHNDTN